MIAAPKIATKPTKPKVASDSRSSSAETEPHLPSLPPAIYLPPGSTSEPARTNYPSLGTTASPFPFAGRTSAITTITANTFEPSHLEESGKHLVPTDLPKDPSLRKLNLVTKSPPTKEERLKKLSSQITGIKVFIGIFGFILVGLVAGIVLVAL